MNRALAGAPRPARQDLPGARQDLQGGGTSCRARSVLNEN